MKQNALMIAILIVVAVGGASFYAGIKYQQSKTPSFARGAFGGGNNGNQMAGRGGAGGGGFRPVLGQISASDDKSITVKLNDGSSKIVLVSDKTTINKAAEGSKSDLTNGQTVSVFGTANSDGTVTATNIQLNPINRVQPSPNSASQ